MERSGHVYCRISNPTVACSRSGSPRSRAARRDRHRQRPGGAAPGDRHHRRCRLAHRRLARAVWRLAQPAPLHAARFGIETTFVDPGDLDEWRAALRPETRLLFGETLGNPGLDVLDISTVAEIAHGHRVPLLVDSTFTTPWLLRPFEHGADLVYHSATKFLCGHGSVIGGVLVDSGRFDWERAAGRFAELTEPYAGFHGMVFAEESTVAAFLLRARREGLRDFGACMSPMNAFLILQGIETLPVRMARHVDNTRKIVAFLAATTRSRGSGTRGSSRIRTTRWRSG